LKAYGIEEKYCRAKASIMIGRYAKSSKKIREETLESSKDVVIGYLCAKKMHEPISDEKIDRMAEQFAETIQKVVEDDGNLGRTRNQTKLAIYRKLSKGLKKADGYNNSKSVW